VVARKLSISFKNIDFLACLNNKINPRPIPCPPYPYLAVSPLQCAIPPSPTFPSLSNHQLVTGVHESLSEAKLRGLDIMSQAGSRSQAMDIAADAATADATTPAASAVGNQRNVSQHAAETQQAKWLPPEFLEKRLTASNEVNYKKLNESLLEKIVELSQTIKSLNGRITFLEEQYESFKNQQANNKNFVPIGRPFPVVQPTPSTPEPPMRILPAIPRNGPANPQTTRAHLAPMKDQNMVNPKYTKVHLTNSKNVQHGPEQAGRPAMMKKKTHVVCSGSLGRLDYCHAKERERYNAKQTLEAGKLVRALYPKAEGEIVIHFDKNTGFTPTDKLARDALNMVNKVLVDKDVLSPPFLCSRFSRNNNLVFTTSFNYNNIDYDVYLSIISKTSITHTHTCPSSAMRSPQLARQLQI
jgi:hypothetical protein